MEMKYQTNHQIRCPRFEVSIKVNLIYTKSFKKKSYIGLYLLIKSIKSKVTACIASQSHGCGEVVMERDAMSIVYTCHFIFG